MKLHLLVPAAILLAPAAAFADFSDDFTAGAELQANYSYFVLDNDPATAGQQFAAGDNTNSFAGAGGGFDLTAGGVDLYTEADGGFNFTRLTRSGDSDNAFDLTQPSSVSVDVSGLDQTFFDAIRQPIVFGFGDTGGNDIVVQIQQIDFETYRYEVIAGGTTVAGQANAAGNPNNGPLTLNLDDDSLSLTVVGTTVVPDTAHGLTFDPNVGAKPFFESRVVFGSNDNTLTVTNFTGTGTAVPEPTTLALLGVGGIALLRRRRA